MNSIEKINRLKDVFKTLEKNFSFLRLVTIKKIGKLLYKSTDKHSLIAYFDRMVYMRNIENERIT